MTTSQQNSIADLRVYQLALDLEDKIYKLAAGLPTEQRFTLANDLRRASAGVAHYINEAHRRYSHQVKIDSLHAARTEAETVIRIVEGLTHLPLAKRHELTDSYTVVIKQTWGLIKYLGSRQLVHQEKQTARVLDELVTARQG